MSASDVHQLTTAELAAARLRRMAEELLLQAEELEATVPSRPTAVTRTYTSPLTGKVRKIKKGQIKW